MGTGLRCAVPSNGIQYRGVAFYAVLEIGQECEQLSSRQYC